MNSFDVIVVGKGNAALCAALAAHDQGARVAVLEAANEDESGGNTRFACGVMRFAYETVEDLTRVTDITPDMAKWRVYAGRERAAARRAARGSCSSPADPHEERGNHERADDREQRAERLPVPRVGHALSNASSASSAGR